MVKKAKNAIIPMLGLALALQAGGCKKDKESRTDLLVGEWKITKVDGVTPTSDEDFTYEFEADGDFDYCYEYSGAKLCSSGDWEWGNDAKDEIEIAWVDDGEVFQGNLDIEKISKDELEGDLTINGFLSQVEFEKVD